jgi:secreted protein with Ig-like and vWFA domain
VRIALAARPVATRDLPPANLVFLIDVSGSMQSPDKLPLVQRSLRLLVEQLRPQDRVALVAYAGAAGLVLPATSGAEKARILGAVDALEAGGSTAGGEGLVLAYRTARAGFVRGGVNRVVLATDGDFNVGVSSDAELERLVERERASGVTLTVLGFGTGNYQDAKMEKLARRGDGNYAYVDDVREARKALVEELGATLHVVARDVKLQVEFNPAAVRGWRLVGYENRVLRDEDFADDAKDAGDVGAGHTVTALYEIVPRGVDGTVPLRTVEPLRYGSRAPVDSTQAGGRTPVEVGELLHVALRYKRPGEPTSRLLTHPVRARDARGAVAAASADFRFAASVAAWGMLLRDSEHRGRATPAAVLALARGAGRRPGRTPRRVRAAGGAVAGARRRGGRGAVSARGALRPGRPTHAAPPGWGVSWPLRPARRTRGPRWPVPVAPSSRHPEEPAMSSTHATASRRPPLLAFGLTAPDYPIASSGAAPAAVAAPPAGLAGVPRVAPSRACPPRMAFGLVPALEAPRPRPRQTALL